MSDTQEQGQLYRVRIEAAMACTVAVEEVIGEHYNKSVNVTHKCTTHTSNVIVCISQLRELLSTELGDEELMKV